TNEIDSATKQRRDVVLVESDAASAIGAVLGHSRDVRGVHVHGHDLDAFTLFAAKLAQEASERISAAAVGNVHDVPSIEIVDHGHVLVALLKARLIDADPRRQLLLATCEAAIDSALHDAIDLIPSQAQTRSDHRDRRRLEPV